jgi:hypothetical protein
LNNKHEDKLDNFLLYKSSLLAVFDNSTISEDNSHQNSLSSILSIIYGIVSNSQFSFFSSYLIPSSFFSYSLFDSAEMLFCSLSYSLSFFQFYFSTSSNNNSSFDFSWIRLLYEFLCFDNLKCFFDKNNERFNSVIPSSLSQTLIDSHHPFLQDSLVNSNESSVVSSFFKLDNKTELTAEDEKSSYDFSTSPERDILLKSLFTNNDKSPLILFPTFPKILFFYPPQSSLNFELDSNYSSPLFRIYISCWFCQNFSPLLHLLPTIIPTLLSSVKVFYIYIYIYILFSFKCSGFKLRY